MDNLETLNSRLICVWLHVFCVARKERAFPLYNKAHSFLSLSLSLLPLNHRGRPQSVPSLLFRISFATTGRRV